MKFFTMCCLPIPVHVTLVISVDCRLERDNVVSEKFVCELLPLSYMFLGLAIFTVKKWAKVWMKLSNYSLEKLEIIRIWMKVPYNYYLRMNTHMYIYNDFSLRGYILGCLS